ncbi:MAG: hypothetical protein K2H19_08230 [Ruminococcus sp.]|nr:hypothetical protein [Ruminococcus sp.]
MIKLKRIISAVVAMSVLASMTACGDKSNNMSESSLSSESSQTERTFPADEVTEPPTEPISAAADGPRLYIKDTTAKAGEYAEVTLAVENANMNWYVCGLHITYSDALEPMMFEGGDEKDMDYTLGDASRRNSGSVTKLWRSGLPDEITEKNMGCFFFTEVFSDNHGLDGDIATFYLKVPEDAESGTVYDIGFYHMDSDLFMNKEEDLSLQMYAFENWKPGTVTVE